MQHCNHPRRGLVDRSPGPGPLDSLAIRAISQTNHHAFTKRIENNSSEIWCCRNALLEWNSWNRIVKLEPNRLASESLESNRKVGIESTRIGIAGIVLASNRSGIGIGTGITYRLRSESASRNRVGSNRNRIVNSETILHIAKGSERLRALPLCHFMSNLRWTLF